MREESSKQTLYSSAIPVKWAAPETHRSASALVYSDFLTNTPTPLVGPRISSGTPFPSTIQLSSQQPGDGISYSVTHFPTRTGEDMGSGTKPELRHLGCHMRVLGLLPAMEMPT